MNKLFFLSLILAVLCLSACKKSDSGAGRYPLHMDMQSTYNKDLVRIELDNDTLFNDTITTNPVLGLARPVLDTVSSGIHFIKVFVNQHDSAQTRFDLSSELYIGIGYTPAKQVTFNVTTVPFVYL